MAVGVHSFRLQSHFSKLKVSQPFLHAQKKSGHKDEKWHESSLAV